MDRKKSRIASGFFVCALRRLPAADLEEDAGKHNDCKNGKKILIIGDSYNKCVAPYLSQTFESTTLLDRRYFDGSVIDYIDKTDPDIVIIAYTPTLIGGVESHTSTFNFE